MSSQENYLKYAHTEGHTYVCYEERGRYLLSCGSDGYVKIWDGIDDCDPVSKHVAENVLSVAIVNSRYFVGTDSNSVLAYTFPKSVPDGLVTRFTAQVTHLTASSDGQALLVGSSDFSIKFVQLSDNSFKVLLGHEAPILSVAIDSLRDLAASSSCDGSVRVWKLSKQKCIKSWASVFPKSNDFGTSKVCCRLAWQPANGKYLAVPMEKSVKLFQRDQWEELKTLTDSSISDLVNVVCFTKCGTYLAAGCLNGIIVVWNVSTLKVIKRLKHEKELTICSMAWNPAGNGELVFCDLRGHMCYFKDVLSQPDDSADVAQDISNYLDIDEDDENTFSISKIKASAGFDDIEDSELKLGQKEDEPAVKAIPQVVQPQHEIQPAFQPGSTPVHYQRRFMVWNSVGIVRCFDTEDENAIEIEFHDSSIHHSMHLENALGHTMAHMSNSAVVLACRAQTNNPSQLVCLHFASWDNRKQWSCEMPENENIEAICVSDEWVALVTNQRQIRLFSIGGNQIQVLTLPGPVVAMAGHQDQFLIAYHHALGLPGNQCLALMHLTVNWKHVSCANIHSLPLSANSTLAWFGYTDEGTPCTVDSNGIVRLLHKSAGDGWMEIANTKSQTKGFSDHYFIVGLSEIQQQIRCILCKGSRYPATLPHPTLTTLAFRLPMCGMSTQFGQMEEDFRRVSLLFETFEHLDRQGFETDHSQVQRTEQQQKESLMKLFALACRNDHEFRSVELAKMMDTYHTVQLAIRYASQLKHLHLADKLGEVAYEKLEQETAGANNAHEEAEVEVERPIRNSNIQNSNSNMRSSTQPDDDDDVIEESQELFDEPCVTNSSIPGHSNDVRHNPFKVNLTPSNRRGVDVLDSVKFNGSGKGKVSDSATTKPKVAKQQTKLSANLNGFVKSNLEPKSDQLPTTPTNTPEISKNNRLAAELWMKSNLETLKSEHPDANDDQLAVFAAQAFKQLPAEEKLKWTKDVKKTKKRKLVSNLDDKPSKHLKGKVEPKNSSVADKLKSFAFHN